MLRHTIDRMTPNRPEGRLANRAKLPALAASVVLLAGACGGSDGEEAEVDITNEATTTTVASTEAVETDTDGESAAPASVDVDRYCELRATADAESDAFFEGNESFDPVAMEAFVQEQIGYITEATTVAPAELLLDLQIQLEGFNELDALLAENGYDIIAVATQLPSVMETPEREASSERLEAFTEANCPTDETAAPPADDAADDGAADDGADGAADDPADDGSSITADGTDISGLFSEEDVAEAEEIIAALQTPAGRTGFIEVVTADGTLTADQAGCLIDNLTPQLLLEVDLVDQDGPDAATPGVLELFETCDVLPSAFGS